MKAMTRFFAIAALCLSAGLALAGTAFSATYYVDYVNGYDANSGTSPTNAWKHCPGDGNATYSATMTPQPGDTIVFKGGTTYTLASTVISAKNSGTSGKVITYTSGHLLPTPWGSGRAVIDASKALLTGTGVNGALALKNYSYITVSGLAINGAPWKVYTGAIGWGGATGGNIVIDDCKLTGSSNGVYIGGNWNSTTPANFTISNTECSRNLGHGILFRAGLYNLKVLNCLLHDNGPGPSPYDGDGIFFAYGNTGIHPTHVLVKGNTVYNHPTKGAFLLEGINDAVFEDNFIYGTNRFWFGIARANGITFRNNLFAGTFDLEPARINPSSTVENIWFYNNTFSGYGVAKQQFWINHMNSYVIRNITLQNNIFTNAGGGNNVYIASTTPIPGFVSDYNIYHGGSATPFQQNNTRYTLAGWRSVYNSDAHSQVIDPKLASTTYLPQLGSPAAGAGLNISSLNVVSPFPGTGYVPSAFTVDKSGTQRPAKWTLGCYEYPTVTLMPPILNPPS